MTTFYIEPDPDETDPLLLAHNAELKRRRAKPGNYGKYIGPGEIMSRTDKGDLSTIMRDGEAKHFWRAMAETRAAGAARGEAVDDGSVYVGRDPEWDALCEQHGRKDAP